LDIKKSSFQPCLTAVFLIEKKYFARIGDNFTAQTLMAILCPDFATYANVCLSACCQKHGIIGNEK
jgi:hypothetical protein